MAVYAIRGLLDLADLARSKDDARDRRAGRRAGRPHARPFEGAWWMPAVPQHADSLRNPGNEKVQQRHWIGVTPMEAELLRAAARCRAWRRAPTAPPPSTCASAPAPARLRALPHRRAPAATAGRPRRGAADLHAQHRRDGGRRGQLRPARRRPAAALHHRQPASQLPSRDEQPGAMPEIAPSPLYGRSIDRPFLRARVGASGLGRLRHRSGRSCTSSSASARTWAAGGWRSCRSCRPTSGRSPAATSARNGAVDVVASPERQAPGTPSSAPASGCAG